MMCIKEVLDRIIIGWCSNNNKICIFVGCFTIEGGSKVQLLLCEELLNVIVLNGRNVSVL